MKQLSFVKPAAIEIDGEYLTDHNRSSLSISNERLVNDFRTQFGAMRRYFRADKKTFSVSWTMLPHTFEQTVDRNLGAEDMIELFETKRGAVNLVISNDFGEENEYTVLITNFSSTLVKRWDDYRFYEVSLEMSEV